MDVTITVDEQDLAKMIAKEINPLLAQIQAINMRIDPTPDPFQLSLVYGIAQEIGFNSVGDYATDRGKWIAIHNDEGYRMILDPSEVRLYVNKNELIPGEWFKRLPSMNSELVIAVALCDPELFEKLKKALS